MAKTSKIKVSLAMEVHKVKVQCKDLCKEDKCKDKCKEDKCKEQIKVQINKIKGQWIWINKMDHKCKEWNKWTHKMAVKTLGKWWCLSQIFHGIKWINHFKFIIKGETNLASFNQWTQIIYLLIWWIFQTYLYNFQIQIFLSLYQIIFQMG